MPIKKRGSHWTKQEEGNARPHSVPVSSTEIQDATINSKSHLSSLCRALSSSTFTSPQPFTSTPLSTSTPHQLVQKKGGKIAEDICNVDRKEAERSLST